MLRINKQGFTLIELMVVIVIIGVLASLAIPRFTDASTKAKIAEAPRIIASFESAYLAGVAEGNVSSNNLVFSLTGVNLDSKWFTYALSGCNQSTALDADGINAKLKTTMAKITPDKTMYNSYVVADDVFKNTADASLAKYVPNFNK
jgi:prepilin-type N-terminal cleavage/methylation domain-containing protein